MVKPPTPAPDPDRVQAALESCLEVEGDDRERRLRDLSGSDPELGALVAERLAALDRAFEHLLPPPTEEPGATNGPRRIGEYELREELGRGGMGVVYAAWQPSLRREVAIKLVRPEFTWFPGARQRFEREALGVARLDHPSIVTVHAVGDEDGVPYLVMERLRGAPLSEVLGALSDRRPERLDGRALATAIAQATGAAEIDAGAWPDAWPECAMEIAIQVADALQHAHDAGLVHRDVKPSNVMLSADGRVRLFDFGLTRHDDDGELTRSGAQVGTLQYMAPEQVVGASAKIGPRTDVHALGAVLFELLALRPAYEEEDRRLLERAIVEGVAPPLRALNRAVPADLETVQRVAMAPEAGQRYASAAAFAADLRAVRERRPIQARPPGALLTMRRFAQRRPALVTALGLGLALVVGLPSAFLVAEQRSAAELEELYEAEQRTAAELEQLYAAEQRTAEELAALYQAEQQARAEAAARAAEAEYVAGLWIDSFDSVAPRRTGGELPSMLDVLESGRTRLLESADERPAVRGRLAAALARVYLELDRFADARDLADEALALLSLTTDTQRSTAAVGTSDGPTPSGLERLRSTARMTLASALVSLADRERTDAAVEAAEAAVRAHDPDQLCNALTVRGRMHLTRGESEAALEVFRAALEAAAPTVVQEVAAGNANIGTTLVDLGRHDEALEYLDRAIALLDDSAQPYEPDLMEAVSNRGVALRMLERLPEAADDYDRAAELAVRLYGPTSNRALEVRANQAGLRDALGDAEFACDEYGRLAEDFAARFSPEHPNAVICFGNHAGLMVGLGRFEEAIPVHRTLLERQRAAFGPNEPMLGFTHIRLGKCLLESGQRVEASDEFTAAAEVMARTERFVPDAVRALATAVELRLAEGDRTGAETAAGRARELGRELPAAAEFLDSIQDALEGSGD